jgi:hypothetical protein
MGGWGTAPQYHNQQKWHTTYEIKACAVFTASVRNSRLILRSSQVLEIVKFYRDYCYLFWRVAKRRSDYIFKHLYRAYRYLRNLKLLRWSWNVHTLHNPIANYCVGKNPLLDLILYSVRNIFPKFFEVYSYYPSTDVQSFCLPVCTRKHKYSMFSIKGILEKCTQKYIGIQEGGSKSRLHNAA